MPVACKLYPDELSSNLCGVQAEANEIQINIDNENVVLQVLAIANILSQFHLQAGTKY